MAPLKQAGAPPDGLTQDEWNKQYNNADSRINKKHGLKAAQASRASGATREAALEWERTHLSMSSALFYLLLLTPS